MTDLSVRRTLVKSPPELWSELSEVESLARHLGELGEIRISRLEPEHTVAWEGEQVRGTVEIEASGWGTKVTLTAEVVQAPAPEPTAWDPIVGESEAGEAQAEAEAAEAEVAPAGAEAEPEAAEVEVAQHTEVEPEREALGREPEADAPMREQRPEPAREPLPPRGARTPRRRGFLGRWLTRRRDAGSGPLAATRTPPIEPVLASAIADGAVEVVEKGSGRAEREVRLAAGPHPDPEPVEVAPIAAVQSSPLERAQTVLESALDSLGQAHHRPFSRE